MLSNRSVLRRAALWGPPILYALVIFYLSSQSNPLPGLRLHVWDKALHALEYGGFAALLARALRGEGASHMTAMIGALVIASAYGASDEWHQSFVPGRDSSIFDWMADTIGGATLAACGALIDRPLEVSRSRPSATSPADDDRLGRAQTPEYGGDAR